MLTDAANLLGCVTAIPDEYPALVIIIALSSTVLDCLALPRLAKFALAQIETSQKQQRRNELSYWLSTT